MKMKLYLMRHGKADWADWDRPDDERPLNKQGAKQMKRVARILRERGVAPAVILSSPLPRARQTADHVAEALGLAVTVEPMLAPGFDRLSLRELLKKHDQPTVMMVGHEPDLSNVIEDLTGGVVVMNKAAIACVNVVDVDAPSGELLWLVTPKFLR